MGMAVIESEHNFCKDGKLFLKDNCINTVYNISSGVCLVDVTDSPGTQIPSFTQLMAYLKQSETTYINPLLYLM